MSKPFVKIVDGKLSFVAEEFSPEGLLNTNTRVISILGKARMGKSTFLNTFISRITGQNSPIFKTTDTLEHCTRGIDYYYIESHNLLLLDSQGIGHQDSSHDPALLLLVYLISDIVIFNERMMLQNEALKLLEPICAFMTYVDLDEVIQKPHLFFRISDGDMIKSEEENLDLVLRHYDDQYESIRESIRNLFDTDIQLLKTDSLDKKCKRLLSENDYLSLLIEGEVGFEDAIDSILKKTKSIDSVRNYLQRISTVIEQINNNEKINIQKLDVVGMTARDEIRDWIDTIDKTVYNVIEVDGTQECYDDKVEKRKNIKKSLLTVFTKKFKVIPEKIRKSHYERLENNLNEPIQKAIEESITKAELRVKRLVDIAQKDRVFPSLTSRTSSFTHLQDSFFDSYLSDFHLLLKAIDNIYKPVKEKYTKLVNSIFEVFYDKLAEIKKKEEEERKEFKQFCDNEVESFEETLKTIIESLENSFDLLKQDSQEILIKYVNENISTTQQKLCSILKKREFRVSMVNCSLNVGVRYTTNGVSVSQESFTQVEAIQYDLVKDIYITYKNSLDLLIKSEKSSIVKFLVEKKNKILFGKLFHNDATMNLILQKNREITFVDDKVLDSTLFINSKKESGVRFMSYETYTKIYEPLLTQVRQHLVSKGYMKEITVLTKSNRVNNHMTEEFLEPTSFYMGNLQTLFKLKLKKVYCKEFCDLEMDDA